MCFSYIKSYGEFGELVQLQFEHPAYPLELLESLPHKLTDRRGVPIVPPISNFRLYGKFRKCATREIRVKSETI